MSTFTIGEITAFIAAFASAVYGWLAHRRMQKAQKDEVRTQTSAQALTREQNIWERYEGLVEQLQDEGTRLRDQLSKERDEVVRANTYVRKVIRERDDLVREVRELQAEIERLRNKLTDPGVDDTLARSRDETTGDDDGTH